jgi:hypothetical protein
MIPLISSMCTGPLGIRQLPRTWWKVLLRELGQLDPDYPDCSRELDDWCLLALELDRETTLNHLRRTRPTYLEFESWVLEQKDGAIDANRVARWNAGVERRVHVNPAKITETYSDIGYTFDRTGPVSAVTLNCLQDWSLWHQREIRERSFQPSLSLPALISSLDVGPLGVLQLARTWHKVLLRARGLLDPDYPDCGQGLDAGVLEVLGLDPDETLDHLRTTLPSYIEFESWIRTRTDDTFDRDRIEQWHHKLLKRIHPDRKRADIHRTIGREDDGTLRLGVMLNHVEDWAYAHRAVLHQFG